MYIQTGLSEECHSDPNDLEIIKLLNCTTGHLTWAIYMQKISLENLEFFFCFSLVIELISVCGRANMVSHANHHSTPERFQV